MAFDYPPLNPDPDPAPLSPSIPLNPPMVGEASPFEHVDGQNRDLILESIRAWIRHSLLTWTTKWQEYLVYWLALVEAWLEGFITAASEYITEHAVSGYSWRTTVTPIASSGTTDVVITLPDPDTRPLIVGDFVSDQTEEINYGRVTVVIDATHATVSYLGSLGTGVQSIVAGANVTVDATDPAHPIVSATGGGGGSSTAYGTYADRPAASAVDPLSSYVASDIGETYLAVDDEWVLIGGHGSELAYAQSEDDTLITSVVGSTVPLPGLVITFVAGTVPIMVNYLARVSGQNAGDHAYLYVTLSTEEEGAAYNVIARTDGFAGTPALNWNTRTAGARLYGLTPGQTYSVRLELGQETTDTGHGLYASDPNTPCYIEAVTL